MPRIPLRTLPLLSILALGPAVGCTRDAGAAPSGARLVHAIEGFLGPESVRYDPEQDVFFVSNIRGHGSIKDGDGYIARIDAANPREVTIFVAAGRNGAVLDAPKGMAIQGDTLWVADIDVVRGFHRRTGAPVGEVDLRPFGAVMLNDVALGPDGSLRVTDSGIVMSDKGVFYPGGERIFAVSPGRAVTVVAEGTGLEHPNGITWDARGGRWIVASFHPFVSELYAMPPGDTARTVLARGRGRFDGVEVLADGRVLYTSWSDSSLHVLSGGRDERLIRGLWQPADLGVDTRRGRVAVPLVLQGRVWLWELPER